MVVLRPFSGWGQMQSSYLFSLVYLWKNGKETNRKCLVRLGYSGAILSMGPWSPSTTCLGYSGPILSMGPWSPSTTCLGYSGPILSMGPWSPCTTCLGYSGPILSLFYHGGQTLTIC